MAKFFRKWIIWFWSASAWWKMNAVTMLNSASPAAINLVR